MDTTIHHKQ